MRSRMGRMFWEKLDWTGLQGLDKADKMRLTSRELAAGTRPQALLGGRPAGSGLSGFPGNREVGKDIRWGSDTDVFFVHIKKFLVRGSDWSHNTVLKTRLPLAIYRCWEISIFTCKARAQAEGNGFLLANGFLFTMMQSVCQRSSSSWMERDITSSRVSWSMNAVVICLQAVRRESSKYRQAREA